MAGYKINSIKSIAFLYSKDKQAEKEVREISPFTIATNNIKYLGMTLTKQVKDLYDKNFKSLKKDIEEDFKRWKKYFLLFDCQHQYSKNGHLAKSNLQIQCNLHQNPKSILCRSRKSNS